MDFTDPEERVLEKRKTRLTEEIARLNTIKAEVIQKHTLPVALDTQRRKLKKQIERSRNTLERLDKSKQEKYKQFSQDIRVLKTQKLELTTQVQLLQHDYDRTKTRTEKIRFETDLFTKAQTARFDSGFKDRLEHVEEVEEQARTLDQKSKEQKIAVSHREQMVASREKDLTSQEESIRRQEQELKELSRKIEVRETKANQYLEEVSDKTDSLELKQARTREELEKLEESIRIETKDILKKRTVLNHQVNEFAQTEARLKAKQKSIDKKARELKNKEKWLQDREETVGRAYREVMRLGGKVG